jgi:hypothetical protein
MKLTVPSSIQYLISKVIRIYLTGNATTEIDSSILSIRILAEKLLFWLKSNWEVLKYEKCSGATQSK